jgi:hypothetical protein
MKSLRTCLCGSLVALAVALAPTSSEAANVRLTLGGDYHMNSGALFNLMLGVDVPVVGPLSLGGRFGVLLATANNALGVPLDLVLRANFRDVPIYIEGLVGPWLVFQGDVFRGHGAFGFGFQGRGLSLGIEVGWLDPSAHIGLRLGWRF